MRKLMTKLALALLVLAVVPVIASSPAPDEAKMEKGKKVYTAYCVTCHQATGQGMTGIFPPLAKSDYLTKNDKMTIIKSVVKGLTEKTTVNGVEYSTPMPPIPPNYTDEDVAAVLTFVLNSWGNPGGEVTVEEVAAARK